jgi:non-ribosomal peptide synthetase component E (peptide arylation enzyme)
MSSPPPIYFTWNGSAMEPIGRFSRLAEHTFTSGHAYRMIVEEERSTASHRQYMAAVHEAWMQLPEPWDIAFPTEDHLRKYALIKAGFCTITKLVSKKRMPIDGYAIVCEEDGVTTVYQAKSQSYKAMGKEEFAASKTAVLDLLADMIGITSTQLLEGGNGTG